VLSSRLLDDQDVNNRIEQRTNLFVLATLSSASASGQVRIRNMSPIGALIEGPVLPAVGEQLHLSRGASSIEGRIAWCRAGKAGVRFCARVEVGAWTPGGNTAQHRVDGVVQQVKTGAVPLGADERSISQALGSSDLERLAKAVDSLSDALADDPATVARFGSKLQTLDVASQVLRKLSRRTSCSSSD
jgi:hypothetical protein